MSAAAVHDNAFWGVRMTGPVVNSLVFHVVVVVLLIVGIPYISEETPVVENAVAVELVESPAAAKPKIEQSEKTVKERPPQNEKEPPKTLPKKPAPQVKELPKPAAAALDAADELAPPPLKKEPAPAVKKPEPKKEPAPPAPLKRPMLTKTEDPQQEEDFKSVLKNLLPDEAVQSPDAQTENGEAKPSPFAPKMSMGEMDALRSQLARCWKLMSGARYAENLVVDIKIFVSPDRTVRDARIVDTLRYNTDSFYRAAADSALRAVRNPECNPLDLPPQKYDLWREMTVSFDPREML